LVQKIAQARELLVVAQIGRGNLFVELGGINFITPSLGIGERLLRAIGPHGVFRLFGVAEVFNRLAAYVRVGIFAVLVLILGEFGFPGFALVLAFLFLAVALILVAFAFGILVATLIGIFSLDQIVEDGPGEPRECFLIAHGPFEFVEVLSGPLFDERPPQLDRFPERRGRRLAGKLLAHHQA